VLGDLGGSIIVFDFLGGLGGSIIELPFLAVNFRL
jgi:hypothetical protein